MILQKEVIDKTEIREKLNTLSIPTPILIRIYNPVKIKALKLFIVFEKSGCIDYSQNRCDYHPHFNFLMHNLC